MMIASPWWLMALVPWGAVAWWMMRGSGERTRVPFLELWRGSVATPRVKRSVRPPPTAIVMVLLAMLLGIFAAAGPGVRSKVPRTVTVVLDRGVTVGDESRRRSMVERARSMLGNAPVELVLAPGGRLQTADWVAAALQTPGTALDTAAMLMEALRGNESVVVLSDRVLPGRPIQVSPGQRSNVGVVHLSARGDVNPQIMLTIRNDSAAARATVRVSSGNWSEQRTLELPPTGGERRYFIDAPKLEPIVGAELLQVDDVSADNQAWTVRQSVWPRIEVRPETGPDVARMIEAYSRARITGEGAKTVVVTRDLTESQTTPAIIVAASRGAVVGNANGMSVRPHAVTRNVDWTKLTNVRVATPPAGEWMPVVSVGDRPLVTVRAAPVRAAWLGFDQADFAKEAAFAVLWTNLLGWVGEGGVTYASEEARSLGEGWEVVAGGNKHLPAGWWPGIYRKGNALVAINSAKVSQAASPQNVEERLAAARRSSAGTTSLSRPILLAAIGSLLAAAVAWPVRRGGA